MFITIEVYNTFYAITVPRYLIALPLGTLLYCNPWPMKCQRTNTNNNVYPDEYELTYNR